jgi:two-component system NtrC family sensor kinase
MIDLRGTAPQNDSCLIGKKKRRREMAGDDIVNLPDRKADQHVVLLVDDEPLVRAVLTATLKDCGLYVIAVGSALEATWFLSKLAIIDVVFSDIKMPVMDGFELAKWVHENKPEIPVILASGYTGKANMAAELCGAEFISKPLDFDNIEAKIRDTLSRKKPLNS